MMINQAAADLHGQAVLIVEDEYHIAEELSTDFRRRGAVVIGPAPTVQTALALIDGPDRIDVAVLDVNLCGELSYSVADALRSQRIPYIFSTGYSDLLINTAHKYAVRLTKPVCPQQIAQSLRQALQTRGSTSADRLFSNIEFNYDDQVFETWMKFYGRGVTLDALMLLVDSGIELPPANDQS